MLTPTPSLQSLRPIVLGSILQARFTSSTGIKCRTTSSLLGRRDKALYTQVWSPTRPGSAWNTRTASPLGFFHESQKGHVTTSICVCLIFPTTTTGGLEKCIHFRTSHACSTKPRHAIIKAIEALQSGSARNHSPPTNTTAACDPSTYAALAHVAESHKPE